MDSPLYIASAVVFVALVALLFGLILHAVKSGSQGIGYENIHAGRITFYAGAGMVIWLAVLGILAVAGFFQNFDTVPPRIMLAVAVPVLFIIWLLISGKADPLLMAIPETWLVGIQSFRIVMELILWAVFAAGVIPVQMTFEGQNWDVLPGLLAPLVAYFVFVRKTWPGWMAVAFNISGLALLFNIIIVSTLSAPTPMRVFMEGPANTFVAYLPFVWLPGFVVPVALAGHVLSLRQLWLKKRASVPTNSNRVLTVKM